MDAVDEVRAANDGFYRAFESLDLARMDEVWAHDGQVLCVHPGWPLAVGWAAVRATWRTIFQNTAEIGFEIADERVDVRGDLGWVVCVERLASGGDGDDATEVLATNVFRREGGRWRLVHHHASPHVAPEPDAPRVVN